MARWTFEPGHTAAEFKVRHMMVSYVRGHFKNVHGSLVFDPDNPRESSVDVVIDTNELWTGDPERDAHLKGPDFLDVERFPTITFKGQTVDVIGAHDGILTGDADGWIARARDALGVLGDDARAQARQLALRLVARAPQLNLSRWARALARTADRVGLIVCGDLPAARRFAGDGGATDDDLVEFALGPEHLRLRGELGLSIDV